MLPRPSLQALADVRRGSLPSLCAVCHGWGAQRVCEPCLARFGVAVHRCRRCAIGLPEGADECGHCLREPPAFARSIAAVGYRFPWDGLVARLKFDAALDLAPVLAERLAAAVEAAGDPRADLVVPVPLGPRRLAERGFNQAWELARRVAKRVGVAADPHLLLRVRDAEHQLALKPAQRRANVRGSFAVEPRRRAVVQGRRIALVDDVMTTGATADEAARVLLQAGAASVAVWVVARTPAPHDR